MKCLFICLVIAPLCSLQCFKVSLGNEHLTPSIMWFLKKGNGFLKGNAFAVHCISYKGNHRPHGRAGRCLFSAVLSCALSPWEHFSRRGTRCWPNKHFPIALQKRQNVSCSEYSIFLWPLTCKHRQTKTSHCSSLFIFLPEREAVNEEERE